MVALDDQVSCAIGTLTPLVYGPSKKSLMVQSQSLCDQSFPKEHDRDCLQEIKYELPPSRLSYSPDSADVFTRPSQIDPLGGPTDTGKKDPRSPCTFPVIIKILDLLNKGHDLTHLELKEVKGTLHHLCSQMDKIEGFIIAAETLQAINSQPIHSAPVQFEKGTQSCEEVGSVPTQLTCTPTASSCNCTFEMKELKASVEAMIDTITSQSAKLVFPADCPDSPSTLVKHECSSAEENFSFMSRRAKKMHLRATKRNAKRRKEAMAKKSTNNVASNSVLLIADDSQISEQEIVIVISDEGNIDLQ